MSDDPEFSLSALEINEFGEKAIKDYDTLSKDEFSKRYLELGACYINWRDGRRTCRGGVSFAQCDAISYLPDVEDTGFEPRRPCPR